MCISSLRKSIVELKKVQRRACKEIKMMKQLTYEERLERLRLLGLGRKKVGHDGLQENFWILLPQNVVEANSACRLKKEPHKFTDNRFAQI